MAALAWPRWPRRSSPAPTATPGGDDDPGKIFEDRAVRLRTTFGGSGVLFGDLTPECAAVLTTVLDALSAPRGAEDTRSHAQRYHDALEEAMRRRSVPPCSRDGPASPRKSPHISLANLMDLDANSTLQKAWTEQVRRKWAAHRAAASVSGGASRVSRDWHLRVIRALPGR